MLSRDELAFWYERLRLPAKARPIIDLIRSSDPARRVGGGRRNVTGRYPSRKMGLTIQFESHRVELAAIYEMEHSPDVLEYYDQPQSIKLLYEGPNGRRLGVMHTPDFFVLRENSAGWEEWKTEEDLHRLEDHNANRYGTKMDGGDVRPERSAPPSSDCPIVFGPPTRSIGSCSAICSSWRTISVAIRLSSLARFASGWFLM